jgi:hypothetical protein
MTNFPILVHLRVLSDPTRTRKRVIAMRDIPGDSFIGTLDATVSLFQLRHASGLLLRTPHGGYLVPVEDNGLHCIAPAGREVPVDGGDLPEKGSAFVLCPELANIRIVWEKRVCDNVHPSFYTTRYVHAGEELMVNVDGECLTSFLRRHGLVLASSEKHGVVDGRRSRESGVTKGALEKRWRCIEDAEGNPFLVR